jgi:4-hydroxybenzoate polyprenyltransferase
MKTATAVHGGASARVKVGATVRALRLHHWAKNALVLVPLAAAHRVAEPGLLARVAVAFLAFGLVASSVYVLNDLLDVEADRRHPRKRHRPFASGALPGWYGAAIVPLLLILAALVASTLPAPFQLVLAAYLGLTAAYSFGLKRQPVLDVCVLAALYTARLFAGGAATGIEVSQWLATFAGFLFLSLAFLKRASELVQGDPASLPGRGYVSIDREAVFSLGAASGYAAVVVLGLYLSSDEVLTLYAHPGWLWALPPLLLYWVSRMWVKARRGAVHDDPLVHAFKDPASWAVAAAGAIAVLAGT